MPFRDETHESSRLYNLARTNARMRDFYGFELESHEYDSMCTAFSARVVPTSKPDAEGRRWGWVKVRDAHVYAGYLPNHRLVASVMPQPPPLPEKQLRELLREEASAMAQRLTSEALSNKPSKRADVAWFKSRLEDVANLLRTGNPLAALLLADSAAHLEYNVSPSKHPEEAEAQLRTHAAKLLAHLPKHQD